jgi:toxin-antitoxin system PIN domain toxin
VPACLLDSNVWLAAAFAEHPAHAVSRRVLGSASVDEPALWCRATQQSFLRLASTPVITQAYGVPKTSNGDAWAALQTFLALPQVDVIDEPPDLGRAWNQLGAIEQAAPKRWMDAYLAAFAITAGLPLISLDQDFRQFEPRGLTLRLLQAAGDGDPAP